MPLQNRVNPEGEIVAVPARGLMMGNRGGCLHDSAKTLGQRRWVSKAWICCQLRFKSRQRTVMSPGQYTELFFLDETTALAAGHRPCFECRRGHANAFAEGWNRSRGLEGRARAAEMDAVLHEERATANREKRVYLAVFGGLSDGTMVKFGGEVALVRGGELWQWTFEGYRERMQICEASEVELLTPPSIVAVLGQGYEPLIHDTAMI